MAGGSSTVDSAEMIDLLMSNVDRSVPILIENVNDNPHSFFLRRCSLQVFLTNLLQQLQQ